MLEDAYDNVLYYPLLFDLVRDLRWVYVDSSNVSEIPGGNEPLKEKLDSMKDKIIIFCCCTDFNLDYRKFIRFSLRVKTAASKHRLLFEKSLI